jgi:hypothetical protein
LEPLESSRLSGLDVAQDQRRRKSTFAWAS